jgi:hypothetical protein
VSRREANELFRENDMAGWISGVLLAAAVADKASTGPEVELTATTTVRFASVEDGSDALTADDAFAASLSRFDMQCRMKTNKEVQLADWKRFAAGHVRAWDENEIRIVSGSLSRLSRRLADFRLPLPKTVLLIRTTGEEEGDAAYTRGSAIVLPTKALAYPPSQLDRLLAHELFHLVSRQDGALRARLYRMIGFEPCEPIELPSSLAPRRITNPDAPLIDCTIELRSSDGKTYLAAPVLYSSTKEYDPQRGGSLFRHLTFRLMVVERSGERLRPKLLGDQPVVIDARKEPAYFEKIGRNTDYVIHPDEILADNFVRLVMADKDLPTPRVVEELRAALVK